MSDRQLVPLDEATASDIRDLKRPGIVLPIRKDHPSYLVTEQDGKKLTMALEGSQAFLFFPINPKTLYTGLFLPEPEILVDFSSATEGGAQSDRNGSLIMSHENLCVVASHKSGFMEPECIPLWQNVRGGSDTVKIAFAHWGLGIRRGDKMQVLWKRDEPKGIFVDLDE